MGLVCTKCPCGVKIRAGRLVRATWLIEDYTRAIVVETSFLLGPVASRSYLPDAISKRKSMLGQGARRVAYRIFYLPVQREEP